LLLEEAIENKIRLCSAVLIMAGMTAPTEAMPSCSTTSSRTASYAVSDRRKKAAMIAMLFT
jgi:hypothetical protein